MRADACSVRKSDEETIYTELNMNVNIAIGQDAIC